MFLISGTCHESQSVVREVGSLPLRLYNNDIFGLLPVVFIKSEIDAIDHDASTFAGRDPIIHDMAAHGSSIELLFSTGVYPSAIYLVDSFILSRSSVAWGRSF